MKAAYNRGRKCGRHEAEDSGLPLIAFVRHPLDRMISAFSGIWMGKNKSLDKFVDKLIAEDPLTVDKHVRPQHWFLYQEPEYLGRYENLNWDWYNLQGKFPYLGDLPHKNGSNHKPWQELLTGELLDKAKRFYAKDLEMFGYG